MTEKYDDNISVDYLNGFLRCLSGACHGCNYVACYGALSFSLEKGDTLESLKNFLGIQKFSALQRRKLKNFCYLDYNASRHKIDVLLKKWVDDKLFEGRIIQESVEIGDFFETYKDDLLEQIEIIAGKDPDCFYANLEHDAFEYDCEIIGYIGNGSSFFIHFSHSD